MAAVQQAVEDRRGQHFVPGQHVGPVLDPLVRRDQDTASLIAMTNQSEEQARLLPGHRLEPDFVDHQQGGRQVLLAAQPCDREISVPFQQPQQLLESIEHHPEPGLDRLDSQSHSQVSLPNTRWSLQQQRSVLLDPLTGRQGLDPTPFDRRLEREVEPSQGQTRRQAEMDFDQVAGCDEWPEMDQTAGDDGTWE